MSKLQFIENDVHVVNTILEKDGLAMNSNIGTSLGRKSTMVDTHYDHNRRGKPVNGADSEEIKDCTLHLHLV